MKKLKNNIHSNMLHIEYVDGKEDNSVDGINYEEKVLYIGEYTVEPVKTFTNAVVESTGWTDTEFASRGENEERYFHFKRPLRADEVSRMYQFSTDDTINGVPVGVNFVMDSENATEQEKESYEIFKDMSKRRVFDSGSGSFTRNKYQTQFNPDWVGYAMVFVADEYKDQLKEILDEPVPYHWVDYDRVPVIFDTTMVYRVEVDRLESLVTGSLVTMTEYDPQYINGVNEDFRNHILSEKTYYFDMNNVDMEAVNALKAYIKIELDMDSDKL